MSLHNIQLVCRANMIPSVAMVLIVPKNIVLNTYTINVLLIQMPLNVRQGRLVKYFTLAIPGVLDVLNNSLSLLNLCTRLFSWSVVWSRLIL